MHPNLNKSERDLIKLSRFFRKRAEDFVAKGKITEEQKDKIITSCESLENSLNAHAGYRDQVLQSREGLKKSVQDNAECPKCHTRTQLKLTGTAIHEHGWRSNKYRCRKCNVEFVWNRPNNPWDMLPFIESVITDLKGNLAKENVPDEARVEYEAAIQSMYDSLARMKPVLEASDKEYAEMELREKEMAQTVKEFSKYLMIEKIRLSDAWDDNSNRPAGTTEIPGQEPEEQ